MLDKGVASLFGSIGFDGGAAGRGAGGFSSWLRLLNKLMMAALPDGKPTEIALSS